MHHMQPCAFADVPRYRPFRQHHIVMISNSTLKTSCGSSSVCQLFDMPAGIQQLMLAGSTDCTLSLPNAQQSVLFSLICHICSRPAAATSSTDCTFSLPNSQCFASVKFALPAGIKPLLLDQQYRMHPLIAQVPSELFYQGQLKSGELRKLHSAFHTSHITLQVVRHCLCNLWMLHCLCYTCPFSLMHNLPTLMHSSHFSHASC